MDAIMNKLIFIEGISGVGKTTTAMHLRDKFQNMGCAVTCYLEGDPDNPLDPFKGTYPPLMPFATFTQTYLHCWQQFMDNRDGGLLILDGTLLHHLINDFIRNYDASNETIVKQLSVLLQVIWELEPIVFYLSSGDVNRRLMQVRESRKQAAATKEQIAFWENRKQVDLYVLSRIPVKVYMLNVDDGWDRALETMIEYVMLPARPLC